MGRLARARILARAGRIEQARTEMRAVVDVDSPAELCLELARLCRSSRDFEGQRLALQESLVRESQSFETHVELAKWHEHRDKDLSRALCYAERALELALCVQKDEALHRCRRLRWRLERPSRGRRPPA